MIAFETARLLLRGFTESDYGDLYEFLSQRRDDDFEAYPDITFENGRTHLDYRVGCDDFIAVEHKESGRVIGNIYFAARDFEARELGYIINKDYQRKGYATEAIKEIISRGFSDGVHRIYAECDPRNLCSWGLLESLGFRREALLKRNVYFKRDGEGKPVWQDTYIYALLNE